MQQTTPLFLRATAKRSTSSFTACVDSVPAARHFGMVALQCPQTNVYRANREHGFRVLYLACETHDPPSIPLLTAPVEQGACLLSEPNTCYSRSKPRFLIFFELLEPIARKSKLQMCLIFALVRPRLVCDDYRNV